jgi:hypothetical protein
MSVAAPEALIIDRRKEISSAGLHVLVVGVSNYERLPPPGVAPVRDGPETYDLHQLESAALTACAWVETLTALPAGVQLTRPLKTCRLLLSPSATEAAGVRAVLARLHVTGVPPATREAVRSACIDWRSDAEADGKEALTVFYFISVAHPAISTTSSMRAARTRRRSHRRSSERR